MNEKLIADIMLFILREEYHDLFVTLKDRAFRHNIQELDLDRLDDVTDALRDLRIRTNNDLFYGTIVFLFDVKHFFNLTLDLDTLPKYKLYWRRGLVPGVEKRTGKSYHQVTQGLLEAVTRWKKDKSFKKEISSISAIVLNDLNIRKSSNSQFDQY